MYLSHQDHPVPMLIQLAEHEVEVGLLGKLLQRVRRLHNPKAGRGGVEVAFGRGVDDRGDVSGGCDGSALEVVF